MTQIDTNGLHETYQRDGYFSPITVMSPEEAVALRTHLENLERERGDVDVKDILLNNPHYCLQFAFDLIHHPKIVAAAKAALGEDVLCWSTGFFIKEPGDEKYISWHQDLHYWGLEGGDEVTAWLAFAPSTPESGCMRVIPGSHSIDEIEHRDTWDANNLLSRGQEIVGIDENEAVDLILQPGQISLHHGDAFHGSLPNVSQDRRIGFTIRYITPAMRQTKSDRDWACRVSGADRHGHFLPFDRPERDLDPADIAFRDETVRALHNVFYA